MDLHVFISFVLATLFETLTPGPTLALVLDTRIREGKEHAQITVAGITAANVLWVLVALFALYAGATWLKNGLSATVQFAGNAYLIYLASSRVLSSTVQLVVGQIDEAPASSKRSSLFKTGFFAHAGNPVTVAYYLATFSVATSGRPIETALNLGFIAVMSDLLAYGVLASINLGWINEFLKGPLVRLFAGLALLYLVAHVSSGLPKSNPNVMASSGSTLAMLGAFLGAAVVLAHNLVVTRREKDNKVLWRITALWGVWFSLAALVGAIYTMLLGFNNSALALGALIEHRIRICFVVAAVLATTLAFTKALGELQDERYPPTPGKQAALAVGWQASPLWVGCAVLGFLIAVFVLFTVTGFRVQ